jgi:hypothetical protein
MKKNMILTLVTVFLVMLGCDKNKNVDSVYRNNLETVYPNAKYVEWDYDDGYMTAEFRDDGMDVKVWFDDSGRWLRIETDMSLKKLPRNIQDAFTSSDYADWKIEDIDYVKIRKDFDEESISYYEFEVEKEEREMEFAIYPDGTIADKPYFRNF